MSGIQASTGDTEVGELGVKAILGSTGKFETSLGYMRSYLKTQ